MGRWAFRFVLFYILVLITQPHFRFPFLIPLRLGDLTIGAGVALHVLDCMTTKKPIVRFNLVTQLVLLLITLMLIANYFNPLQRENVWMFWVDGIVKTGVITIVLNARVDSVYKAAAVLGTLAAGTLWWLKSGVRLASAGAYWASTERIMGANVSMITNPNDFAYMTSFMMPIYFFLYHFVDRWYLKAVFLGLLGASVYVILQTGSRTGFLCLMVLGVYIFPMALRANKKMILYVVAGSIFLWPLIPESNRDRVLSIPQTIVEVFTGKGSGRQVVQADEESARSRWVKSKGTFRLILAHPLGVGTNPVYSVYQGYPGAFGVVHNEMLLAGRIMGFPGMALYLSFIIIPFRMASRAHEAFKEIWPQVAMMAWTLRAMLLMVLVGGMFSPSFFHLPHLIVFVCAHAIWQFSRDYAQVEHTAEEPVGPQVVSYA